MVLFSNLQTKVFGNTDFQSEETYLRAFDAYPGSTDSILQVQQKNHDSALLISNAPSPFMP